MFSLYNVIVYFRAVVRDRFAWVWVRNLGARLKSRCNDSAIEVQVRARAKVKAALAGATDASATWRTK